MIIAFSCAKKLLHCDVFNRASSVRVSVAVSVSRQSCRPPPRVVAIFQHLAPAFPALNDLMAALATTDYPYAFLFICILTATSRATTGSILTARYRQKLRLC